MNNVNTFGGIPKNPIIEHVLSHLAPKGARFPNGDILITDTDERKQLLEFRTVCKASREACDQHIVFSHTITDENFSILFDKKENSSIIVLR